MDNKENTKENLSKENDLQGEEKSSLSLDKKIILTDLQKKKLKKIRFVSNLIDYLILIISILALLIGIYAFWDTHQLMEVADPDTYALYKPNSEDRLSYEELKKINPDLIGWVDVYGTKIDYPIVQGKDNDEYLNKTVLGKFSTTGSIFLDAANSKDFSDYQNILYGHFMAERKMFGDLELFKDKEFFDSHKYGLIHRDGEKSKGIEFFAFLKTVGTDPDILSIAKSKEDKPDLIDHIYKEATFLRKLNFSDKENLVVLDTCDFSITNGRSILIGRLTDNIEENIYQEEVKENPFAKLLSKTYKINYLLSLIVIWILLVIIYLIYETISKKKKREEAKKNVQ